MMDFILREVFEESGRNAEDYLKFYKLDPMYDLHFKNFSLTMTGDADNLESQLETHFPGSGPGFRKFLKIESQRYEKLFPCLQKPYGGLKDYFSLNLLKAAPWLSAGKSMYEELGNYFGPDELRVAFTFQAKYLGMSPWDCPALFTMIPYVEHGHGIYHIEGGLNNISRTMAKEAEKDGATFHLNTPVKQIHTEPGSSKKMSYIELEDGEKVYCDAVILNADIGHAINNLFDSKDLSRNNPKKINKMKYSCSTYMLYLGLDTKLDLPHHSIWFSEDYKGNLDDIFQNGSLSEDPSFYLQNASLTDPTLAPEGHSALYVLMPVSNNQGTIDWSDRQAKRNELLEKIEKRTGIKDIKKHITYEKIVDPNDWQGEYNVHFGATFNLAHNYSQLLHLRPQNRFPDVKGVYLVGGGTHPGSGLPTIYESAKISVKLIEKDLK
jgi:phytoene desaturase